jgi:O-methyltransferase
MTVDDAGADLYLDLMKRVLTRSLFLDEEVWELDWTMWETRPWHKRLAVDAVQRTLGLTNWRLVRSNPNPNRRANGGDWPPHAETMVGLARLDNLHDVMREIVKNDVPGDVIETGTWRGGSAILMRAALKAYGDRSRTVWVADSFQGLPKPDPRYQVDEADQHWTYRDLAVSEDQVRSNFERYGLLDDRVRFLAGWFEDTLPTAPIERLSVLRMDGDMYLSTWQVLQSLYPKVSPGGYVIVDDFDLKGARQAVLDYRAQNAIASPIIDVDGHGAYWQVDPATA